MTPKSRGAARGARLKLHPQITPNSNTVTGYGPDYIEVNRIRHVRSVILAVDAPVQAWRPAALEDVAAHDLAPVLALEPELVLLGTGAEQRFPGPELAAVLVQAHIGFEIMDTGAACRTFNILVAEGRRVVGALLLAPSGEASS